MPKTKLEKVIFRYELCHHQTENKQMNFSESAEEIKDTLFVCLFVRVYRLSVNDNFQCLIQCNQSSWGYVVQQRSDFSVFLRVKILP